MAKKKRKSKIKTKKQIQEENKLLKILLIVSIICLSSILIFVLKTTIEYKNEIEKLRKSTNKIEEKKDIVKKSPKNVKKTTEKKELLKPKVAIILDDAGHLNNIQKFNDLKIKLNISILPNLKYTKINYEDIKKSNYLFPMIHIPMEPKNFENYDKNNLNFITTQDSEYDIYKKLNDFYNQIPSRFANNHMGSKISESSTHTNYILKYLKQLNIHFLDSKTTSKTKFSSSSKILDYKIIVNDIFLDNNNNFDYIKKQFLNGLKLSSLKKPTIMIGHITKDQTYKFLNWLSKSNLKKDYDFVFVSELY